MTEPAVVFDLGMVLCPPQGLFSGLAELLGTTAEAVEQGFWGPHRHRYDEGCSDLEYWQAACPLIPGAQEVDLEQLLPSLIQVDVASWSTPRPPPPPPPHPPPPQDAPPRHLRRGSDAVSRPFSDADGAGKRTGGPESAPGSLPFRFLSEGPPVPV